MKKLFVSLVVIVFLFVLAWVGALYYIRPEQALNLAYEKVPLKDRAIDMARRMSLTLVLTDEDLNNLLLKSLAENPHVKPDIEVTGARFDLDGDRLIADLNVVWKNNASAALQLIYRLEWNNPSIVGTVESAKLKGIGLPVSYFSGFDVPLDKEMPKPLKIKSIKWGNDKMTITFAKPKLRDLQELIG